MSEESPEIPSLKKSSPVSPKGTSGRPVVGSSTPTSLGKIMQSPVKKAAAFVLMIGLGMGLGLGVLGLTVFEFDASEKVRPKGLAGLKSRLHIRRGFRKRVRYLSSKRGDLLSLIRGSKGAAGATEGREAGAGDAADGGIGFDANDVNLNFNDPGEGDSSGDPSGDAPSLQGNEVWASGGDTGASGQNASAESPSAHLSNFAGKAGVKKKGALKFRRDTTATAETLRLGQRRRSRKSGATSSAKSRPRRDSLGFVHGGSLPVKTESAPAASAADEAEAGGGGGGGSSGGGGAADVDAGEKPKDPKAQIKSLIMQAKRHREKAEKEEKKAKIAAATGNNAAAHYHYRKSEKEKDKAKDAEDQAQLITMKMIEGIGKEKGEEKEDESSK